MRALIVCFFLAALFAPTHASAQPSLVGSNCAKRAMSIDERRECLSRNLVSEETALGASVKLLEASLTRRQKGALASRQKAWLAEREKGCRRAHQKDLDGLPEDIWRADCRLTLTRARVAWMHQALVEVYSPRGWDLARD